MALLPRRKLSAAMLKVGAEPAAADKLFSTSAISNG